MTSIEVRLNLDSMYVTGQGQKGEIKKRFANADILKKKSLRAVALHLVSQDNNISNYSNFVRQAVIGMLAYHVGEKTDTFAKLYDITGKKYTDAKRLTLEDCLDNHISHRCSIVRIGLYSQKRIIKESISKTAAPDDAYYNPLIQEYSLSDHTTQDIKKKPGKRILNWLKKYAPLISALSLATQLAYIVIDRYQDTTPAQALKPVTIYDLSQDKHKQRELKISPPEVIRVRVPKRMKNRKITEKYRERKITEQYLPIRCTESENKKTGKTKEKQERHIAETKKPDLYAIWKEK